MWALVSRFLHRPGRAPVVSAIVVGVDRSRKVPFLTIAWKPAPMLVPDRLTVKSDGKSLRSSGERYVNQQLRRLVDD
jgi:hypothetical protein